MAAVYSGLTYCDLDRGREPNRLWDGFPDVQGKSIFIKPNLVSPPTVWDSASCTHISVVRLVLKKIFDSGQPEKVLIGDCGFKDQFELTMELSEYPSLLKDFPELEIIPLQDGENFHKFTLQRLPKGQYMSLFGAKISNYVLDSDVIINLPKMKVHSMAGITGAIKNMMGCMAQKGSMHPKGSVPILHKRLRDLYFLLRNRVSWILMDGIIGSEYCEQYGNPVNSGVLISGKDGWTVDCMAAQCMGIHPSKIAYLNYIKKDYKRDWPEILSPDIIKLYHLSMFFNE